MTNRTDTLILLTGLALLVAGLIVTTVRGADVVLGTAYTDGSGLTFTAQGDGSVVIGFGAASPYWTSPDTPIARWDFETTNATASLDSGPSAIYHATNRPNVATGPTWYPGYYTNSLGRAESIYQITSGGSKNFLIGNSSAFDFNTNIAFTAMGWIAVNTLAAEGSWMSRMVVSATAPTGWMATVTTARNIKLYVYNSGSPANNHVITTTGTINSGYDFEHVAIRYDGNSTNLSAWSIYTNGVMATLTTNAQTLTSTFFNPAAKLCIGSRGDSDYFLATVNVDNYKIFNSALSSNSIYNLYQYTHPTNNMEAR